MGTLSFFLLVAVCCWGVVGEGDLKRNPEDFSSGFLENKFTLVVFDENESEERIVFYEYLNSIFTLDLVLIDPNDDKFLDIVEQNEIDTSTPCVCVFLYGMRLGVSINIDFEKGTMQERVAFIQKRVERRIQLPSPVAVVSNRDEVEIKLFEDYKKKKALVLFCTDLLSGEVIDDVSLSAQPHHIKTAKATEDICQFLWNSRIYEFIDADDMSPLFVSPFGLRDLPEGGFVVIIRGVTGEDVSPTLDVVGVEGVGEGDEAEIVRSLGKWIQRWSFPAAMTLNKDNMKKIEKAHRTYAIIYGDAGLKSGDSEFILNNIRLLQKEQILPNDWIFGYAQGIGAKFLHSYGRGELTFVLRHHGYTYKSSIGNQYDSEKLRIIAKEILRYDPMERSGVPPKKVKTGKVNTVIANNFIDVVVKSEKVVLLATHDFTLPEADQLVDQLQEIGKSMRKTLKVCKMDTYNTLPTAQGFFKQENSPTFYMFHPTTKEVSRMPSGYDLKEWAENHRFLSKKVKKTQLPFEGEPPKMEL